jgi:hypothetical protein
MDYEEQVRRMIADIENDFTNERYNKLIRCLGVGLSSAIAMIDKQSAIDPAVEALTHAIKVTAHEFWTDMNSTEVDAAEYLQKHFNPTKTND